MFDKIIYISDESANIKLKEGELLTTNLMNLHLVFEDQNKKILGEVDDMDGSVVKARFLGEIVGDKLIGGTIRKPSLDAKIRVIDKSEIPLITGSDTKGFMKLGVSPFYDGFPVFLNVNSFFSNHFAIMGNTGAGKSCGVSRLFQNMFHDKRLNPYKANILIFDSSGEYYNAFHNLNEINPSYNYRFISTNEVEGIGEKLRLPIYLLNKDDLALLLQCTSHSQLPIIERMLKLALVFSQSDVDANKYKNHLIAKAIMTILYTNETAPNKRNEIFSILASCSTPEFNLEAVVQGVGYTRKFRECFLIDNSGNFTESVLLTEYINSFIKDEYDSYEPHTGVYYDLQTLEKALNFTLISEGWLRNENTYGDAVTIRVRLHSLIIGPYAKYFDVENYIGLEAYLSSLLINNGKKYQVVNINLDDVDDTFAKVVVKVFSRLIFSFAKSLGDRASIPFHLVVEEAHRYIQNDTDTFLIGYNIFDRIAKEGRKYGVILGLITQRPVEMSDTVISQCSNFLIFKMNHPADVEYIRKMVPNISEEIVEKQKTLQAGTCLAFGQAFKIPLIVKLEMPDPEPRSGNCDVVTIWDGNGGKYSDDDEQDDAVEEVKKEENDLETKKEVTTEQSVPNIDSSNVNPIVPDLETVPNLMNNEAPNLMEGVPGVGDNSSAEGVTKEEGVISNEEKPAFSNVEGGSSSDVEQPNLDSNASLNSNSLVNSDIAIPEIPIVDQKSNIDSPNLMDGLSLDENNTSNGESVTSNTEGVDSKPQNDSDSLSEGNSSVVDVNNKSLSNVNDGLEDINAGALNSSSVIPDFAYENSANIDQMLGVKGDVSSANPVIPDVNVFVPNMVAPQNATNVSLNQQFSNNQAIVPEVKQEEVKPSVIIPGGQNVGSALMEGFSGVAVKDENN